MLEIDYDVFIRTTDKHHEKAVQDIFTKLYEKGKYINPNMKATIVHHVNPSGQSPNW